MTTPNPERKESILKTLAIAGLLGITVLIAWLSVQIVQVFPAAISSLVSVANSVYNYNPLDTRELTLTPSATTITSGDAFTVSWERLHASGTYAFSFTCNSGVTVDLRAEGKSFSDLNCDEKYDLGSAETIEIIATGEPNRLADLTYSIDFYRPNGQTPAAVSARTVTVVSATIAASTTATTSVAVSQPEPEPVKPVEPVAVKPEPAPAVESGTAAAITPTLTYALPVSNPNGTSDLVVSYVGVGTMSARGVFTKTDEVVAGTEGAFQFAVHNIGSRTSETWSYEATLPGGLVYSSKTEQALRPNERAVITISFPAFSTNLRTTTVEVSVTTKRDTNLGTNHFSKTVLVK